MSEKVFMDASAWIAIGNPTDRWHPQGSTTYTDLGRRQVSMVTTNWTVYEALTLLKAKAGLHRAEELWDQVNVSPLIRVVHVTDEIEADGLDIFFRYTDKPWGVVDCVSFVVMEQLDCWQAFAFDQHFAQAAKQRGFTVIP